MYGKHACHDNHKHTVNLKTPTIMKFTEAVKTVLAKYATFSGRATRPEYWYFQLFYLAANFALVLVCMTAGAVSGGMDGATDGYDIGSTLSSIFGLAMLIPSIAVGVRRLHDTGRSGWNLLWGLLPIVGTIILLVFFISESKGDNQYGKREA